MSVYSGYNYILVPLDTHEERLRLFLDAPEDVPINELLRVSLDGTKAIIKWHDDFSAPPDFKDEFTVLNHAQALEATQEF